MPRKRPLSLRAQIWLRWLHVYTSMISLLVVLFFAITGVTLNHPEWVFGTEETRTQYTGTLPSGWVSEGKVDWLKTAEYLRSTHSLKGSVSDNRNTDSEASILFKAPAYAADALINMQTGTYTLTVSALGFVSVMNDLHKGRDASTVWRGFIDVSAIFLTLVAVSGLGILLYLKKIRVQALLTAVGGTILLILLMRLA